VQEVISFTFKNNSGKEYNSLSDCGIYLSERPTLPRAERNFRYTEIEGRDGTLTEDLETYKDVEIKLSCVMLNPDIQKNISDNLNSWLNGEGGTLTFSYLLGKYFKVKQVSGFEIKESSGILGEFEVTFICEGFRYLSIGLDVITLTGSPSSINNTGTLKSKPVIKIYGAGNVEIYINDTTAFTINNMTDYITIDSTMKDCYRDTQLANNQMVGEFPLLEVGTNIFDWSGNISKIEVQPNWKCL
jgi:predicted phage tail component-like protein